MPGWVPRQGWRRLLTVEDTFAVRERGLIVVPQPGLREAVGGTYEAEVRHADGSVWFTTLELVHGFQVPSPPTRRWTAVLHPASKEDVPIGAEIWIPRVPQHLASTFAMLERAYGGGIPTSSILPVLRLLLEHMSHRNLADVLQALLPERVQCWLNEVYRAADLALDDPAVLAAREHLRAHGYDAWVQEP